MSAPPTLPQTLDLSYNMYLNFSILLFMTLCPLFLAQCALPVAVVEVGAELDNKMAILGKKLSVMTYLRGLHEFAQPVKLTYIG